MEGAGMSDFVESAAFHPMRGHIADGVRVKLRDGRLLRVTSTMRGWTLIDVATGRRAMNQDGGAYDVAAAVVELDKEGGHA
jgi:hypothetical protein